MLVLLIYNLPVSHVLNIYLLKILTYLLMDSLNHWKLGLLHTVLKGLAWNFYQITLCDYTQGTHSKTMVAELNDMCTVNLFHVTTQLCYLNSPEICKDHC